VVANRTENISALETRELSNVVLRAISFERTRWKKVPFVRKKSDKYFKIISEDVDGATRGVDHAFRQVLLSFDVS
jgi:hypothetical protein